MTPRIDPTLVPQLKEYLALLEKWNRIHSLTALPPNARWEELILDSAALLPHLEQIPSGSRIGDFGTGMGMPAVLVALARPDFKVLALDKSKKKLAFVRQASLVLGLKNVEVLPGRFEHLPPLGLSAGIAKALASLKLLALWWDRHGTAGAPFFALKGREEGPDSAPSSWVIEETSYHLPTRGERRVVQIQKGG